MKNSLLVEPPAGLFDKILNRIRKEQRLLALRRIVIFSVLFFGSIVAIIPSFSTLSSDVRQTGFLQFFSLIFSDFSLVSAYWKNFSLAILETLPAVSLAALAAVILILLQSLKSLIKNIKIYGNRKVISI